jgi:hypothetical protein
MVHNYGMRKATSTAYNPQSHGMIERVHQVVEDAENLRIRGVDLDENNPWEPFLVAAALQFEVPSTQHLSHASSTCVRKRYDPSCLFSSGLDCHSTKKAERNQPEQHLRKLQTDTPSL